MTKFFIIHGAYGNPEENWFPWLKEELEKQGDIVFVPKFPTPENQSLENWMKVLKDYEKFIDENTIFVGHSIGVAFILNILEKSNKKVKACFFISGFLSLLGNSVFDKINKTFIDKGFNWKKIKNNCNKFYIFHSDNDPYVPLKKAENLTNKLGTKVIIVKNAGHFNEAAGYKKFDLLLDYIKKETNL
ncbi:MAG: alpha/beta hydrolase [Candidatus Pacearchaeota archaeon]|nr:alpha/beta hydrolase [Candidatus Pacearchaeota archaeon]